MPRRAPREWAPPGSDDARPSAAAAAAAAAAAGAPESLLPLRLKLVLVGGPSCGKTSLVNRITRGVFSSKEFFEGYFVSRQYTVLGRETKIDFWDCPTAQLLGQQQHPPASAASDSTEPLPSAPAATQGASRGVSTFFTGAKVAFFVYAVDDRQSLLRLLPLAESMKRASAGRTCAAIAVIATKADLPLAKWKVEPRDINLLLRQLGEWPVFEVSAKTGDGLVGAFRSTVELAVAAATQDLKFDFHSRDTALVVAQAALREVGEALPVDVLARIVAQYAIGEDMDETLGYLADAVANYDGRESCDERSAEARLEKTRAWIGSWVQFWMWPSVQSMLGLDRPWQPLDERS